MCNLYNIMCNLYNIKTTGSEIAAYFGAQDDGQRVLSGGCGLTLAELALCGIEPNAM
jgi:hypothetical protein